MIPRLLRINKVVSGSAALLAVVAVVLCTSGSAAAQVQGIRAAPPEQETSRRVVERSSELERQFQRALTAWRTGASLFEAKARLDRVLEARPTDAEARKLRAEVLLEMNHPQQALRDARQAAKLRPADGEAHLLHAEAARESNLPEEARHALDVAAEYLPERHALHTRFSWNAMRLDRLGQAEAFGRVALALDSTSAPAYRQLARVFVQRERPDEAAAVLRRGLRVGVVEPRTVRRDDMLRALSDHPRLREFMRP
jgi:tetratricopeptide (TPR) repeat protein